MSTLHDCYPVNEDLELAIERALQERYGQTDWPKVIAWTLALALAAFVLVAGVVGMFFLYGAMAGRL